MNLSKKVVAIWISIFSSIFFIVISTIIWNNERLENSQSASVFLASASPSPSFSPSPSSSPSPTITPTQTIAPSPTLSPTATPTYSSSPSSTPSPSPTPPQTPSSLKPASVQIAPPPALSDCYAYSATSQYYPNGNSQTTTIDLGGGKSITIPNQNPPSILQNMVFSASSFDCAVTYFPQYNDKITYKFVTPSALIDSIGPLLLLLDDPSLDYAILAYKVYHGISDIGGNGATRIQNEDAIINSIASTDKFRIRLGSTYSANNPLYVSDMNVTATNCAKIAGNGLTNIILMRRNSDNSNSSISNFLSKASDFIDSLKVNDPNLLLKYSFYVDLKKQNQDNFYQSQSSCKTTASEDKYIFVDTKIITVSGGFTGQNNKIFSFIDDIIPGSVRIPYGIKSGIKIIKTLKEKINEQLNKGNRVLVLGHSLGSAIAYNVQKEFRGRGVLGIYIDPPYATAFRKLPVFNWASSICNINQAVCTDINGLSIANDSNSIKWTDGKPFGILGFNYRTHDPFGRENFGNNRTHLEQLELFIKETLISNSNGNYGSLASVPDTGVVVGTAPVVFSIKSDGTLGAQIVPGKSLKIIGSGFDSTGNVVTIVNPIDPEIYYELYDLPSNQGEISFTFPNFPNILSVTIPGNYNLMVNRKNSDYSAPITVTIAPPSAPAPTINSINRGNSANTFNVSSSDLTPTGNSIRFTPVTPNSPSSFIPSKSNFSFADLFKKIFVLPIAYADTLIYSCPANYTLRADHTCYRASYTTDVPASTYPALITGWYCSGGGAPGLRDIFSGIPQCSGTYTATWYNATPVHSCPSGGTLSNTGNCNVPASTITTPASTILATVTTIVTPPETPLDNSYEINDIPSSDGKTLEFTVPTTIPNGTYKISVGAFNSPWNDTPYTIVVANGNATLPPPVLPRPTVTLTTNLSNISLGNPITLSWSSTNATACAGTITIAGSGAWAGNNKAISGTLSVTPTTVGNKIYKLTCTGSGGTSIPVSVTVVVAPAVTRCEVSVGSCSLYPQYSNQTSNDTYANSASNQARCLLRANDWTTYCAGNTTATARYYSGLTLKGLENVSTPVTGLTDLTMISGTIVPLTRNIYKGSGPASIYTGTNMVYTLNFLTKPTVGDQTIFIHFVDSKGVTKFSSSITPSPSTSNWSGTVSVKQTINIPIDAPAGTYKIMVGLYNGNTRLPLTRGSGVTVDNQTRYQVGTIVVRKPLSVVSCTHTTAGLDINVASRARVGYTAYGNWTAVVSGGNGANTLSWKVGDETDGVVNKVLRSNGPSFLISNTSYNGTAITNPTGGYLRVAYNTVGQKNASVTVTSDGKNVTTDCTRVTVIP
ncbi:MAG: hypothetical protein Q7R78_00280 [bacterium]|nr:hypothetical protein [bacterium]